MNLKIDKEFKELIPPLLPEELKGLEESVLKEGVRDKLVIWNKTVVDGHNRYDIAQRHGLLFQVAEMTFESREDCINWIINNQLGRRNITEQQRMYLRGKRYENEKKIQGGTGANQNTNPQTIQNDQSADFPYPNNTTARKIAKEYGVAPSTIQRDAWYAKGVDVLPTETKQKVFSGEEKVVKQDVHALAKMEPTIQKKTIKKIEKGASITEAVRTTDPKILRAENDKRIRENIQKNQGNVQKTKMTARIMGVHNVTVCSKEEFLNNQTNISNDVEIWIFRKTDDAENAKIEIRKNLSLKFNES